jgi:FAD/FMN-containing dehydrogenase
MARRFGYAADHVRRIAAVTVDGKLREIDADHDPELFWALRGGRDNFGVVTGLDVGLVPVEQLYGGALYFDGSLAEEVVNAWLDWTTGVPEDMTSSLALVPLPDLPSLPPPLRGRYVVHVRIAFLGEAGAGERLIAPLRALGPRLADTVRVLPYTESGTIHNDPVPPAAYSGTNSMLSGLEGDLVHRVLELTGPEAPVTSIVEVRHLGGALSRTPHPSNSVGNRDAAYLLAVLNRVTPETADEVQAAHHRLSDALAPRTMAYSRDDYRRLQELKARWDPANLLRLNHNIPPAVATG